MFALNMFILILVLSFLYFLQKKHISFNKRVFIGLILGAIVGMFIHYLSDTATIKRSIDIYSIFSNGYVRFLQMLIYPIICVATLSAMTKIGTNQNMGKPITIIIFVLLITVAISALVAILVTLGFHLNLDSIISVATPDQKALLRVATKQESLMERSFSSVFTDFITTNPFADMIGSRSNSIASLVIFFILVGVAYLGVLKKEPQVAEKFKNGVDVLYKIVMRLVVIVLRLTPYGIFALFAGILANSSYATILALLNFIMASYVAVLIMFAIHLLILLFYGLNIMTYLKKAMPLLLFSFVSRSSAASIPMNISTQTQSLGVPQNIASVGASFGAIMGQNGCAGIHPAIVAVIVAPSIGIDPTSISFILSLIAIITISSFGIAGVGGGATFATIAVLSTFNMPLTIIALLIGIEPIIDMARTFLNTNDSVIASLVAAKMTNNLNKDVYNNSSTINHNTDTIM